MSAVRAVQKLAAWVDEHLGGAVALDWVGHGGDGLQRLKPSAPGTVAEGGDGLLQLVDHVGKLAARVEAEVARTGAGLELGSVKLGLGDCAGFFVKAKHENLVNAEVGREGELVVWPDMDRVGVRRLLARRDAGALMLDLRHHRADGAVVFDRQHRGATAAVVRHEHEFAGGIDGEMARAGGAGRLLVELGQLATLHVQCERGHAAATFAVERADLVDGVEIPAIRVDLEERRVFQAVHGAEFF